jgi:hypothetical protein
MAKKTQVAVIHREGEGWVVQEIGEPKSDKLYDHKGDAEATAAARAKAKDADVVVEDDEGAIERWDTLDAESP